MFGRLFIVFGQFFKKNIWSPWLLTSCLKAYLHVGPISH